MKKDFIPRRERQKAKEERRRKNVSPTSRHPNTLSSAGAPWYRRKPFLMSVAIVGMAVLALGIVVLLWHISAGRLNQNVQTAIQRVENRSGEIAEHYYDLSLEEREERLRSLLDAASEIECRGSEVWYRPLREAANTCGAYNQHAAELRAQLGTTVQLIAYDRDLQRVLGKATQGENLSLDEEAQKWKSVQDEIRSLSPVALVDPFHNTLQQDVQHIVELWQQLAQADAEEDSETFTDTQEQLTNTFAELNDRAHDLQQLYNKQQKRTWEAYENFKVQNS